ncbi:MAG TPA: hypothetical protein VM841_15315 [Actinomycetota bacterium]|nr:hypothetical protein [Actinomycetota bacterium]
MKAQGHRAAIAVVLALGALFATVAGTAQADVVVGGGTVVVKQQGQGPAADNGTLVCEPGTGIGTGGACLDFAPGGFVEVLDALNGYNVAFQVCIDANGDGVCVDDPKNQSPCRDRMFFSHDDAGQFHNPLGPLPSSMPCGNTASGWNGYVVFLCEGVHVAQNGSSVGGAPHTHETTVANVSVTGPMASSGFGDFCGTAGRQEPVRKPYTIVR